MYIVALCPWDSHVYYDYFNICILVNTMHLCKLFIIKTYLEQTVRMWLTTVITGYHPPLTHGGHVFIQFLSGCFYCTVHIWVRYKFERAR